MLCLNLSIAIGPDSIPTKILKLLINDVSSQLTELFNLFFSRGVFALILKTSKVIPVYKKDSKLKCSNYRPISLLLAKYSIDIKVLFAQLVIYFFRIE